jgi:bacterioferritin-associated ferredoxin
VYACICSAVTVDEVDAAIDGGADTIDAVSRQTGAGTGCHSCHDTLDDLLEARCGGCPLASLAVA